MDGIEDGLVLFPKAGGYSPEKMMEQQDLVNQVQAAASHDGLHDEISQPRPKPACTRCNVHADQQNASLQPDALEGHQHQACMHMFQRSLHKTADRTAKSQGKLALTALACWSMSSTRFTISSDS